MIASLMMYDRPEVSAHTQLYWQHLRAALEGRGIAAPKSLSNQADVWEVWQSPDLVLSQTCGMPYRTRLHGNVQLVGTPDYGLPDMPPGHYASAFVVRADDPRRTLAEFGSARFAYNQTESQSGFAAPYQAAKAAGFWFADRAPSGGHLASARMVAEGKADIAALDGVTWHMIETLDDFASDLRVLSWTAPTPGLPYITGQGRDADTIYEAVAEAIREMPEDTRAALGLRGIVKIPSETYLAVPNPPDDAL